MHFFPVLSFDFLENIGKSLLDSSEPIKVGDSVEVNQSMTEGVLWWWVVMHQLKVIAGDGGSITAGGAVVIIDGN